jgi:hypothetical protein
MKPWVDITGSGEHVTKLIGAISRGHLLLHPESNYLLSQGNNIEKEGL